MAPTTTDEHFKFLISCIRYSNNGKVDFAEVAKECNIVSKGAAAKRYERMMKTHGIAPNAASAKPGPSPGRPVKNERAPSSNTTTPSKKRKTDAYTGDAAPEDDPEDFGTPKSNSLSNFGTPTFKADPDVGERLLVKSEPRSQQFEDEGGELMSFQQQMNLGGRVPGYMPFHEPDVNYATGGGDAYDDATGGFGTSVAGGAYGMAHPYVSFGSFEGSQPQMPVGQVASYHDDAVLISD